MNIAIKLTRTAVFSPSSSQHFGRNLKAPRGIKFQHSQEKPADKMEEADKARPKYEHGDAGMAESFGEGYSTRSTDEGFGGIYGYGGNEEEQGGDKVHGISPEQKEYKKTQGSHVREKEKARNQE